jgi:putative flavoprotein involved in K+ transport
VTRVTVLDDHGFEVETEAGLVLQAPYVVAASGSFGRPHRPQLPGEESYRGMLLHASDYRRPADFAGRRVVVVGGGNSAVQIAHELADVARVTLATRSRLKWQAQRPLGRDMHWWFDRTGLDYAPIGRLWFRLDGNPVVDDGRYRAALAAGAYDHRAMFDRLVDDGVAWPDGSTEQVDAVLLATGYRPDLDYLAGTGALDATGAPLHRGGVSRTVRGLGYVGLEFQRSFRSNTVRGVGADARRVVARLTARRAKPGARVSRAAPAAPGSLADDSVAGDQRLQLPHPSSIVD